MGDHSERLRSLPLTFRCLRVFPLRRVLRQLPGSIQRALTNVSALQRSPLGTRQDTGVAGTAQ